MNCGIYWLRFKEKLRATEIDLWLLPIYQVYRHYWRDRPYLLVEERAKDGKIKEWYTLFRSAGVYVFRSYKYLFTIRTAEKSRQRLLDSTPADSVPSRFIKKLSAPPSNSVVFVTYHPTGLISDHVAYYIGHLKRLGCSVILIKVVDDMDHPLANSSIPDADASAVRLNSGYDFGAWAHGLLLFPEVYQGNALYLTNDSIFGPANPLLFDKIFERIDKSDADLLSLTESFESSHHFQSYFLVFRNLGQHADAVRKYWENVRNLKIKVNVILEYELALRNHFSRLQLKCRTLFPASSIFLNRNPITYGWKNLLNQGFPFLKVSLLRPNVPNDQKVIRREAFAQLGYDCQLIDQHFQVMATK